MRKLALLLILVLAAGLLATLVELGADPERPSAKALPEASRARPTGGGALAAPARAAVPAATGHALETIAARPARTPSPPSPARAVPALTTEGLIHEEVARIAGPVGLDQDGVRAVEELTARAFSDLMDEIGREPRPSVEVDRLIARRTDELHARIAELLGPDKGARYRAAIGLDRP
jgi:hypothetical protein